MGSFIQKFSIKALMLQLLVSMDAEKLMDPLAKGYMSCPEAPAWDG